jgi:hypothetical protein
MTPAAIDTRPEQAERVADELERHPEGCTLRELDSACDLGSPSKVLSDMRRRMGYGIRRGWRLVPVAFGKAPRRRRTYTLTHRPTPLRQLPLFES